MRSEEVVVKVENLSKSYTLGVTSGSSFKRDLQDWLDAHVFTWKKKDLDIDKNHEFWALKNINFEIKRGEVVGFVGRNGSGKSTLLKLISRIYSPTEGSIKGVGKIASLLEIGTGFHEELTGRENVYLNGEILGMSTREINNLYDEIVSFSGIGKFIDTPVKRYSSGMYVRLAFAVAAHINADILIIDEVLAVGDAEFQEKCLAKMKEISAGKGKTIIFVSHDMHTVRRLCDRVIYLSEGSIVADGLPADIIGRYLRKEQIEYLDQHYTEIEKAPGNEIIKIKKVCLNPFNKTPESLIDTHTSFDLELSLWLMKPLAELRVTALVFNFAGDCIFDSHSSPASYDKGVISGKCQIPPGFLGPSSYYISLIFGDGNEDIFEFPICLSFDISGGDAYLNHYRGLVHPDFPIIMHQN